jgi:hypothetical protein
MISKWGLSIEKNKDGVGFRSFRKRRHFENNLFELGAVDYIQLPIFILIQFWEIRKFLTNGLRESACIIMSFTLVILNPNVYFIPLLQEVSLAIFFHIHKLIFF